MSEWLSYAPADFLLFSPQVYWRLFVLENQSMWPLPVLAPLAFGMALGLFWWRPAAGQRLLAALLAAAWLLVGWHFLWLRYAPVNWAVVYVVPLFAIEGALFAWAAFHHPEGTKARGGPRVWLGFALAGLAVVIYPWLAPLQDRPIEGAEVAGIAPDPTALLGLGAAILMGGRFGAVLGVIPLCWLAASCVTLFVLASGQAWVLLCLVIGTPVVLMTGLVIGAVRR